MRDSNHDNRRKADTGIQTRATPLVSTLRSRGGLRVLAKIIARAHLRRQSAKCGVIQEATNRERRRAAPHGPPPEREAGW